MRKSVLGDLSTLVYIEKDGKYLMLHRTVKKNDVNKDKWIGIGGHFEENESPEECLLREVREETGYELTSYRYRGFVTFVSGNGVNEYMCLFTADGFRGEAIECDEGVLEWVEKEKIWQLNLWEGDKIFFLLLEERKEFFSLKLVYNGQNRLVSAALDGKEMELFDILDEKGAKTGVVSERRVAHRLGYRHHTAHVWIVREQKEKRKSGYDILLQKRSLIKDSHPGAYDISSAGHIAAGDEAMQSALRELFEELGIEAGREELTYLGSHSGSFQASFHGKPFHDEELAEIYVLEKEIEPSELKLQKEEVDSVLWIDYLEGLEAIRKKTIEHCIYEEEYFMVGDFYNIP